MREVVETAYYCDFCGERFTDKDYCERHEERHKNQNRANEMLKEGKTLLEINKELNLWGDCLPNYLENVTKDNCFKVSHWQCCEKPAYQITFIDFDYRLNLWGRGSWSGPYGGPVRLDDYHLKTVYSKEDLFVYSRF